MAYVERTLTTAEKAELIGLKEAYEAQDALAAKIAKERAEMCLPGTMCESWEAYEALDSQKKAEKEKAEQASYHIRLQFEAKVRGLIADGVAIERRESLPEVNRESLPTLDGSEKQVAWANDIRQKFIIAVDELMADKYRIAEKECRYFEHNQALKKAEKARGLALVQKKAKWWIEWRTKSAALMLNQLSDLL